jgi:hypothetical protein
MRKNYFFNRAIIFSILYWLIESTIHKRLYSEEKFEFLPSDINELWMRSVIVVLIITFGLYADYHTKSLLKKEEEKRIIFTAAVSSTQHIVFNLINQMQYFKLEADKSNVFDEEVNRLYEETIKEGKELVDRLSAVEELTEENISKSVYPQQK